MVLPEKKWLCVLWWHNWSGGVVVHDPLVCLMWDKDTNNQSSMQLLYSCDHCCHVLVHSLQVHVCNGSYNLCSINGESSTCWSILRQHVCSKKTIFLLPLLPGTWPKCMVNDCKAIHDMFLGHVLELCGCFFQHVEHVIKLLHNSCELVGLGWWNNYPLLYEICYDSELTWFQILHVCMYQRLHPDIFYILKQLVGWHIAMYDSRCHARLWTETWGS